MQPTTIMTAHREYCTRPQDEKYQSLAELIAAAHHRQTNSIERAYNLKDLRIVPTGSNGAVTLPGLDSRAAASLQLESPKGRANFTHWSFGQLCRTIGAPAAYLRELPPAIAADAMNFGLQDSPTGSAASLLVQAPNGRPEPTVRACTSDSYARIWDAPLYDALDKQIGQQTGRDGAWTLPPIWGGGNGGAYMGDRDSFVTLINGGSIVTDPSARSTGDGGQMFRGIMIRNSEVGAASVTIESVLYRYICGNLMLWGAVIDRTYRRRHVGAKVLRDTMKEISRIAWNWTNRTESSDRAIIDGLIKAEVAHTKDAVIDELRALGATKNQATAAYASCEIHESASPRSFWGLAQGLTRTSQETGYQDDRYDLDKLAAQLLIKGRKLVAA